MSADGLLGRSAALGGAPGRDRAAAAAETPKRLRAARPSSLAPLDGATPSCACGAPLAPTVRVLQESVERLERLVASMSSLSPADTPSTKRAATRPSGDGLASPLSSRQLEILGLVAEGLTTEEIAQQLWLSVATVRNHVARSLRALGAHSRVDAVTRARRLGLLP
jgi:DNA-binding CsgD family transcriptional regulator